MTLRFSTFAIVCPLVFLAGLVDSIGGGGGLISIPAYLLAGVPAHLAVGTNKLSSSLGTAVAASRYTRKKLVVWKAALPSAAAALVGSYAGANLSMLVSEKVISILVFIIVPAASLVVFDKKLFKERELNPPAGSRVIAVCSISALLIGAYDGFYGPGTGTFLIIAFNAIARLRMDTSNANAKIVNLTSNIVSLCVFLTSGQVIVALGLAAAACNMIGNYIGAGLAVKNGSRIVKPVIAAVLGLLLVRLVLESTGVI
ncbi:MAG: sulfite exporter TauE/SafE family protein [Oscillospiraceae bacterium]